MNVLIINIKQRDMGLLTQMGEGNERSCGSFYGINNAWEWRHDGFYDNCLNLKLL